MRPRFFGLGLVLFLIGCSSGAPSREMDPVDVAALRVTGSEPVDDDGELLRLSPDGSRLLWMTEPPCVTMVDGSGKQCVDPDEVVGDMIRAKWSPDGTKVAFTEQYQTRSEEPDVWVFDATTGELRNLTDDSRDEYSSAAPDPNTHLDILPSWSPDSATVRFARGRISEETVELMSVPADGGAVSVVGDVPCAASGLVDLAWSAEKVAWLCVADELDLWLAGPDGGDAREVSLEPRTSYTLLSFSADGQWLLVDSWGIDGGTGGGDARAVPTNGGDPVPVADGPVAYVSWAPSGHAVAFVDLYHRTLNIVAEPGGQPRELHSAEFGLFPPDRLRVNWTPDKLLVRDGPTVLLGLAD